MIKFALTAVTMIAAAAPALAGPAHYQPTAQDFRDGRCTRQQVHTPAGKLVHNAPIIRCDQAAIASRDTDARSFHSDVATTLSGATESAR